MTARVIVASHRAAAGIYATPAARSWWRATGARLRGGPPVVVPDGQPVAGAPRTPSPRRRRGAHQRRDRHLPDRPHARGHAGRHRLRGPWHRGGRLRAYGAAKVPTAVLSRGVAGVAGRTLIVNLPGSRGAPATVWPCSVRCWTTPSTRSTAATIPRAGPHREATGSRRRDGRPPRRRADDRDAAPHPPVPVAAPARASPPPATSPAARLDRVGAGQRHDGPVRPLHVVAAERARRPARHAVRRDPAMAGQDADHHRFEEPDPPYRTVPAAPPAGAAAAAPHREALHAAPGSATPAPRGRSAGSWSCASAPPTRRRSPSPAPEPEATVS